jgi:hypothetical protein
MSKTGAPITPTRPLTTHSCRCSSPTTTRGRRRRRAHRSQPLQHKAGRGVQPRQTTLRTCHVVFFLRRHTSDPGFGAVPVAVNPVYRSRGSQAVRKRVLARDGYALSDQVAEVQGSGDGGRPPGRARGRRRSVRPQQLAGRVCVVQRVEDESVGGGSGEAGAGAAAEVVAVIVDRP